MNYRHNYHAGNFADVFKHVILITLISLLQRKENSFLILDTHAGGGEYELFSTAAQKNKEYENGIAKIISCHDAPEAIKKYLQCVKSFNQQNLRIYPGSPFIEKYFLRKQDRMVLSELHPQEFQSLRELFRHQKNIFVHHQDAYQSLKAYLPPKERRGLILIDPPYEKNNEIDMINQGLNEALKRFETGVYAIWYPIKDQSPLKKFKVDRPAIAAELSIYPENSPLHLNGCGMLIVNPPYQLDVMLQSLLPWLWEKMSVEKQGRNEIILLPSPGSTINMGQDKEK